MIPVWLRDLALALLSLGIVCAIFIAIDLARYPQHMWIMNVVWPANGLFGTVPMMWFYFRFGRLASCDAKKPGEERASKKSPPFPVMVAKGAMHCGAGCTMENIIAEGLALAFPVIAIWPGWHSLFSEKIFAIWIVDYIFAFVLGVASQYFTIKSMRQLSYGEGIRQALKADALSLAAWQVGMYGFMAIAQFVLFRRLLGRSLRPQCRSSGS